MSGADLNGGNNSHTVAAAELRAFLERVERLEEEKTTIVDDIKSVYAEAKGRGYDVKTMRQMVRERKMHEAKRQEKYALEEMYRTALALAEAGLA
jgi:uncharacterized protein (UPF0335 family)